MLIIKQWQEIRYLFYLCVLWNTEEDSLEAFMREISDLIKEPSRPQGERIEAEDLTEDFKPLMFELDIEKPQKTRIQPLAPVDHVSIEYKPVQKVRIMKNVYNEHPAVRNLTQEQIEGFIDKNKVVIRGAENLKPAFEFCHMNVELAVVEKLNQIGIFTPTAIQSLAIPVALEGRDLLAVSQTASGKTLAYALPVGHHVKAQLRSSKSGAGALILVPTRELCLQVFKELKRFLSVFKQKVVALYGGVPKNTQWRELKMNPDIIVSTPARLIDMIQTKACSLKSVTQLVIDEADLMFNMGFEYQVRSIISQIRPDRQTLLFSATFRGKLENFVSDILRDPVKITIGNSVHCNPSINQEIIVLEHPSKKLAWLLERLQKFMKDGLVIIFVKHIDTTEELSKILIDAGVPCACLHGDMDQLSRENVFSRFAKGEIKVLVATDIASRGLNVTSVAVVVNYDCAKDVETHVHRIGRTGRFNDCEKNEGGKAYSLLTKSDKKFAGDLLLNLEYNEQDVPDKLEKLAMEDTLFRIQRMKNDKEKIRHCKTADPNTANAIMEKISGRKVNIDIGSSAQELREAMQEQQKKYFQEEFKQKFIKGGQLEKSVDKTTVTYLQKPRKRFDN